MVLRAMTNPILDKTLPKSLKRLAVKISKAGKDDITPDLSRSGVYVSHKSSPRILDKNKIKGYNEPPIKII